MTKNKEEKNGNDMEENLTPENGDLSNTPPPAEDPSLEALQNELLYLRADFDNYRKRVRKEQEQAVKFANEKLVGEILGVLDFFDRALASSGPLKERKDSTVDNFLAGIEMTRKELVHVLSRFGVELMGSEGEKFDPNRHEAISEVDVEASKAGTVITVLQQGCSLQGRVIKPARVVVGKARETGA